MKKLTRAQLEKLETVSLRGERYVKIDALLAHLEEQEQAEAEQKPTEKAQTSERKA